MLKREHKEIAGKFNCGNDYIDKYVRKSACKDKTAITYAIVDKEKNKIVAIMTLVASGIYTVHSERSKRPNKVIPSVEIRNFAVDKEYQHLPLSDEDPEITLSKLLFSYFMKYILNMSKENLGIERIILYSVDRAVTFYTRFGFRKFKPWMARSTVRSIKDCTPMYFCLNDM